VAKALCYNSHFGVLHPVARALSGLSEEDYVTSWEVEGSRPNEVIVFQFT
jgi:hypothetical protein